MLSRRQLLAGIAGAAGATAAGYAAYRATRPRPPNVVMILTDDQGFSDVSCTWQPDPEGAFPRIDTPRIDSLAADGMRLDSFYVGAPLCSPSRAALMTGCYPPRVGFVGRDRGLGVLGPKTPLGLNPDETTLAEVLAGVGYRTGCVGKWHLGHKPEFLPTRQGFEGFYGIPYSNNQYPLPLMRNEEVVRLLPNNPRLTRQFTQASLAFLDDPDPRPFFLYLAHSAPHWPWNVAPRDRSAHERGIYADVIAGIDWSVGEVLDALERRQLSRDTIVIFFSDNGPWIEARTGLGGGSYPYRGEKSQTWEGGVRTPFLARWPGVIPAGARNDEITTAMDLLPTLATVAGAAQPDRPIDGRDIGPILRGEPGATSPHEAYYYFARGRLEAVRRGRFKRVFANGLRSPPYGAALYDLEADPGETRDVGPNHPEVIAQLEELASGIRSALGDELTGVTGTEVRPLGRAL